jgi:hypothetical protein
MLWKLKNPKIRVWKQWRKTMQMRIAVAAVAVTPKKNAAWKISG